jgi:homoserine kinase
MSISVFAPASIGNLSVGFDVLGMAVKPIDDTLLGDVVTVTQSAQNQLQVIGNFAQKLPQKPEQNIVWQCLTLFNQRRIDKNLPIVPLSLTLDKKMPVGSGLGSSACSVVATLVALDTYYLQKVDDKSAFSAIELLQMMGEMEAAISGSLHYDNVAPCFLGGLQLMVQDQQQISQTLPSFDDYYYVMAYPGIEVSTKMAREVLPHEYSRQTLIQFGQNLASFIDACHRQNAKQAFAAIKDVVAEPYRAKLIPRFIEAQQYLLAQGAKAVGISGSGPTLFCICETLNRAEEAAEWLTHNYLQTDEGFVHICKTDNQGATLINE